LIEAIDGFAGTYILTSQTRIRVPQLLRSLQKFTLDMNLDFFEHFCKYLKAADSVLSEKHNSSFFAAFDLHNNDMTSKAYFILPSKPR
jgi:hypothetical protein